VNGQDDSKLGVRAPRVELHQISKSYGEVKANVLAPRDRRASRTPGQPPRRRALAMTGREIEGLPPRTIGEGETGPVLEIRGLTVAGPSSLRSIHGLDLEVNSGEILGVAGAEETGSGS
jgi:hypothetical protein